MEDDVSRLYDWSVKWKMMWVDWWSDRLYDWSVKWKMMWVDYMIGLLNGRWCEYMEDDVSRLYDWSVKWKMMGVDYDWLYDW